MIRSTLDVPPSQEPEWVDVLRMVRDRRKQYPEVVSYYGASIAEAPPEVRCEILDYIVREQYDATLDARREADEVFRAFTGHSIPREED